jgi:hypothetical protein
MLAKLGAIGAKHPHLDYQLHIRFVQRTALVFAEVNCPGDGGLHGFDLNNARANAKIPNAPLEFPLRHKIHLTY